ncbi:MAG: hypothetical protein AAF802_17135 [Planctomycetota bacterium]
MTKSPAVRVGVIWMKSRGRYFLKWKDPLTKKYRTERTDIDTRGKKARSEAIRLTHAKEQELNSMLDKSDITFDQFNEMYRREHLDFTSKDNRYKWNAAIRFIYEAASRRGIPSAALRLDEIKPLFLSEVETIARKEISGGSIGSYLGTLRSGFSWAASMELMPPLPSRRSRGRDTHELPAMRLEPISLESLRKMQGVCDSIVGKQNAKSVETYLQALWLSGCRMREPLEIHAFRRDCHRPFNLSGDRPAFCWTNTQKGRRDVIARITRDFASDVMSRVEDGGFLYKPRCETGEITGRTALSNLVSAIGKKAEVFAEPTKTATAKHFRSSFVTRWSLRGMPIALIQEMVRHRSRATTERYYVGDLSGKIDFDETQFGEQDGEQ